MHATRRPTPSHRPASLTWSARAAGLLVVAAITLAASVSAGSAETIRRETLPDGLRVLLVENHSRPLIGVCIFVNGGSRTETPALSGLSHYYEHLIFRGGSARQAELEFRKQMQRLGEESGGYTTNDYTATASPRPWATSTRRCGAPATRGSICGSRRRRSRRSGRS